VVNIPNELIEFSVKSVTEGIDAMGKVTIRLRYEGKVYAGYSANTDIIVASARAYLGALNRLYAALENKKQSSLKEKNTQTQADTVAIV
jgi:2-isopropylmalate synthase